MGRKQGDGKKGERKDGRMVKRKEGKEMREEERKKWKKVGMERGRKRDLAIFCRLFTCLCSLRETLKTMCS